MDNAPSPNDFLIYTPSPSLLWFWHADQNTGTGGGNFAVLLSEGDAKELGSALLQWGAQKTDFNLVYADQRTEIGLAANESELRVSAVQEDAQLSVLFDWGTYASYAIILAFVLNSAGAAEIDSLLQGSPINDAVSEAL